MERRNYISEAIAKDYNYPYYEKDGKKIEVKNFKDLAGMLSDPDITLRYGIAGLYLSYAVISSTDKKNMRVNSAVNFSIEDSKEKEGGKDFVVYNDETGAEIERFDADDIEAVDADDNKRALSIILKRGATATNKKGVPTRKATSKDIKLVHITNFMFPLLNFNKTYKRLKDNGRLKVEEFVQNPENIKLYMEDPNSDWAKLWQVYVSKVNLSAQEVTDLLDNMTPDVFIKVITKDYGKKAALSKEEIEDISKDKTRIKKYIDTIGQKEWEAKVRSYCNMNNINIEGIERFLDPDTIDSGDFVDIAVTPKLNPNDYLKLVYRYSDGSKAVIHDEQNDLYYIFIEDDDFFVELNKETYMKIHGYFAMKEKTATEKENELDKALSSLNDTQWFRQYLLKNILMFRFYYNIAGDTRKGTPRKMIYVNEEGLDLGSEAANLIANDANGALEKLREKYRDPNSEKNFGGTYNELTNENHFLTFKEFKSLNESKNVMDEKMPYYYSLMIESAKFDTYKFSQIQDIFKEVSLAGVISYDEEWKEQFASVGKPENRLEGGKTVIVFKDENGSNKFIKIEDDYDIQIDEDGKSVIVNLPTSHTFVEIFIGDGFELIKNKIINLKPIE